MLQERDRCQNVEERQCARGNKEPEHRAGVPSSAVCWTFGNEQNSERMLM